MAGREGGPTLPGFTVDKQRKVGRGLGVGGGGGSTLFLASLWANKEKGGREGGGSNSSWLHCGQTGKGWPGAGGGGWWRFNTLPGFTVSKLGKRVAGGWVGGCVGGGDSTLFLASLWANKEKGGRWVGEWGGGGERFNTLPGFNVGKQGKWWPGIQLFLASLWANKG